MSDVADARSEPFDVATALRKISGNLPGAIRFRLTNSLDHFEKAERLIISDREMASFRAITGEEEAATCVMLALKLRGYEHSEQFRPRNHVDKAAVLATLIALAPSVVPILSEFQLVFDFEKSRIDLKVPLSNFDVKGGDKLAVQPVEPLDLTFNKSGVSQDNAFDDAFDNFKGNSGHQSLLAAIREQANARNTLLYASDSGLPRSRATTETITSRMVKAQTLLVITIMILQKEGHARLISQLIGPVLSAIKRTPAR